MRTRVTTIVEVIDHDRSRGDVVVASATLTDEVTVGVIGADPEVMNAAIQRAANHAGQTALNGAIDGAATAWTSRARVVEHR